MTAATLTLTAFIEARIAEDERHARKLAETDRRPVLSLAITVNHPERLLAQVEALRAIVALHDEAPRGIDSYCATCTEDVGGGDPLPADYPCPTLRHLAAIWRDHDDYREEWAA